jgi:hypothetical protein
MIHKLYRKIKYFLNILNNQEDIFIIILILLVGFGGFGLGRLSTIKEGREAVEMIYPDESMVDSGVIQSNSLTIAENNQKYVASINGTKFHHPWCSGANRIKEGNKVWFATKGDAESAGYTPAKNCKGL